MRRLGNSPLPEPIYSPLSKTPLSKAINKLEQASNEM